MVKQVQELIDKIKREGIDSAERKAQDIEHLARLQAEKIIKDAEHQAKNIVDAAKLEAKKSEDSAKMSIKQASRDMMLSVKKEIIALLVGIIRKDVQNSLTVEMLSAIIRELALKPWGEASSGVQVSLSSKDKEKFAMHLIEELQKEIKKELVIRSSLDIHAGLRISFDQGKSSFDFSDESLTEHLSAYLHPQIVALLKGTSKNKS
jgi:V/A-type H+-transporting ATPase subunit E